MELVNFDKERRRYGVKLNRTIYLATLVDLPCIIEAMKTLDYFNFYKSQDASQMVYVHPKKINLDEVTEIELQNIVREYDPIKEDKDFFQSLYERAHQTSEKDENGKNKNKEYKLRDGISPITKNIKNIRFKKKP